MKKRKDDLWGYSLIIAVVFIVFIMVISNDTKKIETKTLNVNRLLLKEFFVIEKDNNVTIRIEDDGYDIYVPRGKGYRYGPSIIYYGDGSMDAWFASNGNSGSEWDWITYRHFDGENWSNEEIVLRPTPNSMDHYSVCDPGVIFFNDYYYIGYTSTENSHNGGVENCGYVARSKNPNGPYEKWNGEGWGGNPKPIIVYDQNDLNWGAGEISFVIVENQLYCYYTWNCANGRFTKLALANLDENWPQSLKEKDVVISRINEQGSVDVVYNDEYQKFIAFCVESSFAKDSCIAVYESNNGIDFKQIDKVNGIEEYAHNMGISKKTDGHIASENNLYIGYAYSKNVNDGWGKWSTKIQRVELKIVQNNVFKSN